MLRKSHRFHGYGSLRRVYQNGQSARGPLVSLKFSPRKIGQAYRVAVVVSRKVHKSAVVRNRIRRRIYEIVRRSDKVPPSMDLVITVFSDQVAELPASELQVMVEQLIQKTS